MRKFYFSLLMAFGLVSAQAQTIQNLYSQTYDNESKATDTWNSQSRADGLSLAGDSEGKYIVFDLGNNNNRSAYTEWGDVYGDVVNYTLTFNFNIAQWPNQTNANQLNHEICVTSLAGPASQANGNYAANNPFIFDLSQTQNVENIYEFKVNQNAEDLINLAAATWYKVELIVEGNDVTYTLSDLYGGSIITSGTYMVPEGSDARARGIHCLAARYMSVTYFDEVLITTAVEGDFANKPSVVLSGLKQAERYYTIRFTGELETLHVTTPDGQTQEWGYWDAMTEAGESGAVELTITQSGTLDAWTTMGNAESDHVIVDVDCTPITLVDATASIIAVSQGYGKTYTISIDNSQVLLTPQIFLDVTFTPEGEGTPYHNDNFTNGGSVTLDGKGKLTIVANTIQLEDGTRAYNPSTVVIDNDIAFNCTNTVDFQHMTEEQLLALGFAEVEPLNAAAASGESNWTARLYMNFRIETGETDEEGNPTYTTYRVYGPNGDIEGAVEGAESIRRFKFYQSNLDSLQAHTLFAPVYTWYNGDGATTDATGGSTNLQVKMGIGLVHSGVQGDAEDYDPAGVGYGNIRVQNAPLGVDGLTDEDFIVVYKIKNYGSESVHPIFPAGTDPEEARAMYKAMNLGSVTEVYKGTEGFTLYRVDTAITRIEVYRPEGHGESVNSLTAVSEKDAPIYTISGLRVAQPAQRGIYIQNGKKFVVK